MHEEKEEKEEMEGENPPVIKKNLLSILTPMYNEEQALPAFFREVISIMEGIEGYDFEIICVNDGSRDNTLEILLEHAKHDKRIKVIDLSRNFGKEVALTAALDYSSGDAVVPLDVDLQDPPSLIPEMVRKWREGYEVVLAKRSDRSSDSYFKRTTAALFYRFHNKISKTAIPENVGDFRLMDRKVVNAVCAIREKQRFMRGIFAWVGFKTCTIEFVRPARYAGNSKFNLSNLWKYAMEGITSFSTLPLTIWLYLGAVLSLASFCYGLYIVFLRLFTDMKTPDHAFIVCLILFFGGLQMLGIGLLGEYLGRTYIEAKCRSIYVVRDVYNTETKNDGQHGISDFDR